MKYVSNFYRVDRLSFGVTHNVYSVKINVSPNKNDQEHSLTLYGKNEELLYTEKG